MGAYTMNLIRNSAVTAEARAEVRDTPRVNRYTKRVEPEWMQDRRNGYHGVTTDTAKAAAPVVAGTTPLDALAARMHAGEFSVEVADALVALLDIPQNVKGTGESIMMYALNRNAASTSGNDITYFEVKSFYSRVKGKTVRRIRQLVGAPGDWQRVTLRLRMQCLALFHILEDQQAAAHLFADTAVACYRCGSPLTNTESRNRRLGPDCVKKV